MFDILKIVLVVLLCLPVGYISIVLISKAIDEVTGGDDAAKQKK